MELKKKKYVGGLSTKMEELINKQIQVEAFSSQIYLQMYIWCDVQGYTGAAKFFKKHSEEERSHMLKLYDFMADRNVVAITPALEMPQKNYIDLIDVIDTAMEHEYMVTGTYEQACEEALCESSHICYSLFQHFIKEQIEEESLFQTILDKYEYMKKYGITGSSIMEFDEMLGDLA